MHLLLMLCSGLRKKSTRNILNSLSQLAKNLDGIMPKPSLIFWVEPNISQENIIGVKVIIRV